RVRGHAVHPVRLRWGRPAYPSGRFAPHRLSGLPRFSGTRPSRRRRAAPYPRAQRNLTVEFLDRDRQHAVAFIARVSVLSSAAPAALDDDENAALHLQFG